MKQIFIDFSGIGCYEDFYELFRSEIPKHFDDNPDALYDMISGELEMPFHIGFLNMDIGQLEIFEDLITTLEDAEEKVEGFTFSYYLEQYEK